MKEEVLEQFCLAHPPRPTPSPSASCWRSCCWSHPWWPSSSCCCAGWRWCMAWRWIWTWGSWNQELQLPSFTPPTPHFDLLDLMHVFLQTMINWKPSNKVACIIRRWSKKDTNGHGYGTLAFENGLQEGLDFYLLCTSCVFSEYISKAVP